MIMVGKVLGLAGCLGHFVRLNSPDSKCPGVEFCVSRLQCSKLSAASKFSKKPTNSGPQNASSADQKPTSQDPQRGLIETFLLFFKIPNNKKRNKRKFYQIFIFITYEINIQMIDLLFLLFARALI